MARRNDNKNDNKYERTFTPAKEMNKRTQKYIEEFHKIFGAIESASSKGNFSCSIKGKISTEAIHLLQGLGYEVSEAQNGSDKPIITKISWLL